MKKFLVTGFSKFGVWGFIVITTVEECVKQRAKENGIETITDVQEVN